MEITDERVVSIYTLSCPLSKDVRYVGKSVNSKARLSQHTSIKSLSSKRKTKINNWLLSILKKGLKPEMNIIDLCKESDNWQLKEKYWVAFYKDKFDLCNLTDGGEGMSGRKLSENHKEALRKFHTGRKHNYVNYFKGKKRGKMSKEKISQMANRKRGKASKRRIKVGLFVNNILDSQYNSMTEAAIEKGIRISTISNNILGYSQKTRLGVWKTIQ